MSTIKCTLCPETFTNLKAGFAHVAVKHPEYRASVSPLHAVVFKPRLGALMENLQNEQKDLTRFADWPVDLITAAVKVGGGPLTVSGDALTRHSLGQSIIEVRKTLFDRISK